jgi:sialidase-1
MHVTRAVLTLGLALAVVGTTTAGASGGVASGGSVSTVGSGGSVGTAGSGNTRCSESVPFRSGVGGYSSYRIPAVVKSADGALLAFAEGRRGGSSDTGDIDIVLRRSTDGGCTWGPQQVVADQGPNTIGNPAPVVDPASGDLVLLSVRNGPGGADPSR